MFLKKFSLFSGCVLFIFSTSVCAAGGKASEKELAIDYIVRNQLHGMTKALDLCSRASPKIRKQFNESAAAYKARIERVAGGLKQDPTKARATLRLNEVNIDQLRLNVAERSAVTPKLSHDKLNHWCQVTAINLDFESDARIYSIFIDEYRRLAVEAP